MLAMVRDDREARHLLPLHRDRAVVADERRPAGDLTLARIEHEGADVPLPVRVVADEPHVDRVALLRKKRRQEREARDRHGESAADHGAEPERRAFEKPAAWKALARRRMRHGIVAGGRGRSDLAGAGLDELAALGL